MRGNPDSRELTKQQFTLLAALEHHDGASQTVLVEITGIDRSTLAEMVRRMLEKGLCRRERTEEDQRANAVAISPDRAGRRCARPATPPTGRNGRCWKPCPLPSGRNSSSFLAQIAQAADSFQHQRRRRVRRGARRPGKRG